MLDKNEPAGYYADMNRLRVYLDTSVVNFVFADDAPEFRQITVDFFARYAVAYDLYISNVVLLEIERVAEASHREKLLAVIRENHVNLLPADRLDEIRELAEHYLTRGIVPPAKMNDALHVAYATVYTMEVILSWNFRHLANVNKEAKIQAVNLELGYRHPLRLLSPLEVAND